MANKITVRFEQEDRCVDIDYNQPDLNAFIKTIVSNNLAVSNENVNIYTEIENFDCEEFKEILISVHEEFQKEIEDFFDNIKAEIKTYYEADELTEAIIQEIQRGNSWTAK